MRTIIRIVVVAIVLVVMAAAVAFAYLLNVGVAARPTPGPIETLVARRVRNAVIAYASRGIGNPLTPTAESLAEGRSHFADHCASCHANDGSGDTELGRGLYPKAPDMRGAATQQLTDAQLFYIIENGVRLTGMPGWGTGTAAGATSTWHLVQFIRHLPDVTADEIEEMKRLNPQSPEEIRQEIEAEQFLQGADVPEGHRH
jgi:mono/diheme cytochrome c family protein